jgi:hypothetical protein
MECNMLIYPYADGGYSAIVLQRFTVEDALANKIGNDLIGQRTTKRVAKVMHRSRSQQNDVRARTE